MVHSNKCQHCGQDFEARREDAKYCSNSCRSLAYQRRRTAKLRETTELLQAITASQGDPAALAELQRQAERQLSRH